MRKCVGIFLVVCLMASSTFAANFNPTAASASWGSPPGAADADWSNGFVPPSTIPEQEKITGGKTCIVDVATGTFGTMKLTVGTSTSLLGTMNIVNGGTVNAGAEVQVGDNGGILGRITQTGGTLNLTNGTASAKLEVGYKTGIGSYAISGGTIAGVAQYSQLQVGASGASGGTGTFTVQGTGGSITVSKLYVGASTSSAQYTGTGTLAFEINGGVSSINADGTYLDSINGTAAAVAYLTVSATGALPTGNIILVKNGGGTVTGLFDAANGGSAAEGATVVVGGVSYTLTYMYDSVSGTVGTARNSTYNDIALIIPEPATIALLGLGLIALRRNKK